MAGGSARAITGTQAPVPGFTQAMAGQAMKRKHTSLKRAYLPTSEPEAL